MKTRYLLILAGLLAVSALVSAGLYATMVNEKSGENAPMQQPMSQQTASSSLPVVDVDELNTELHASADHPVVVDVREPQEREAAKIDGDINVPLSEFATRYTEIPKDKPVVVYCRSGHRSARAVQFLLQHGYTNVKSLAGGMMAWLSRMGTR